MFASSGCKVRASLLLLATCTVLGTGCGGGNTNVGDGGSGGSAGGNGPGGQGANGGSGGTSGCVEQVDSAAVGMGEATTPFIRSVAGGYAIADLRAGEVWLSMVDGQGTMLSHVQLSTAAGQAALPSIHALDGGFVALWAEGSNVMRRDLDSSGSPTGAAVVLATTTSQEPRPMGASASATLATAWMDSPSSSTAMVIEGTTPQSEALAGWFPAVAISGSVVGVSWSDGGSEGPVQVASFDAIGSPHTVTGSSSLIKSMASSDDAFFVAWEDVGGVTEQIGLAKVDVSQGVIGNVLASQPNSSANWPAIAFNGQQLAVAYYQFRDGPPNIYLTYFDADLKSLGIELELAENARYPAIAWGDDEVAVAYSAENGPVELSIVKCP